MNKFKHFILTRYNVGLYSDNPYNVDDPDEWMDDRWKHFLRTVDSVKGQTCKNFEWVIEIDPKTPEIYKDILKSVCDATVVEVNLRKYIKEINIVEPFIITTRLDNDDILNKVFVEHIQNNFEEITKVVDTLGEKVCIFTGMKQEAHYYSKGICSPFASLIEKTKERETVIYRGGHNKLHKQYKVEVLDHFLWLQICHDRNVLNKVK